jgi:RNA polymerase sigma-70 factor (ECF subfamily)
VSSQAHWSQEHSDLELLQGVQTGDRIAFTCLIERHYRSLFRYARSFARTDADAEDALQRTLVSIWKSAGSFSARSSVRAWLLTIARHAVFRAGRSREDATDADSLADLGRRAGWGDESPESLLDERQRRELLAQCLASLSESDRELLVLRDVEGFSGDETAQVLGLSLAAMKSRLHRARLRLVATLTEELKHEG